LVEVHFASDNWTSKPTPNLPELLRISWLWDTFLPFTMATVPVAILQIIGVLSFAFFEPGTPSPVWLIALLGTLKVIWMIALAVVILIRFEFCCKQLNHLTGCVPPVWREGALGASLLFLLLFDILANIGFGIPGGLPVVAFAIPMFIMYLCLIRVAFFQVQMSSGRGGVDRIAPGT
jgi:hypothetical protein